MKRCVFAGVLVLVYILTSETSLAQETCVSSQCHVTLLKPKVVHAATESCESCHESILQPHPQKGVKTFKSIENLPELCGTCHDALGAKKTIHAPVKDGACTTCHDPHASEHPKLLTQSLNELCVTCHSDQTEHQQMHGPVADGDCSVCHTPHESDTKALLVTDGDELCFSCHSDLQEELKKQNIHSALEGGCTSCHNPHGAAFPKMLATSREKICFECHSEIQDDIGKAKSVHEPLKTNNSCSACHTPHASDHKKLLLAQEKNLCSDCHKNVITPQMTSIHQPVQDGDCTACHTPHVSQFSKLLAKSFTVKHYVPYSDAEYELCFSCHNRDLIQYPDTSFATNFRDGERNLHFLHVNKKEKGRNCITCHDTHGSKNPALIADSVPFGKWKLPVKFQKTDTGGSCAPGCHKPYSYNRNPKLAFRSEELNRRISINRTPNR